MLKFIMDVLGEKPADSDHDRQAAMSAGVKFVMASEFFGGRKWNHKFDRD